MRLVPVVPVVTTTMVQTGKALKATLVLALQEAQSGVALAMGRMALWGPLPQALAQLLPGQFTKWAQLHQVRGLLPT